jgi:hypothetical protein
MSFTCWILDVALYDYVLKKWKLEQANNPNLPPFIEWVPFQTMTRYIQMKVYGGRKHTRVSQNWQIRIPFQSPFLV